MPRASHYGLGATKKQFEDIYAIGTQIGFW